MNTGQGITLGLQLIAGGMEVMQAVKDAQDKGAKQIDLELDNALVELASVIAAKKEISD